MLLRFTGFTLGTVPVIRCYILVISIHDHAYVIDKSPLGGMYPVYRPKREGAKRRILPDYG